MIVDKKNLKKFMYESFDKNSDVYRMLFAFIYSNLNQDNKKKISDEKSKYEEGCLSIPNTFIEIERPKTCIVEYIDIEGEKNIMKCDGLLSTCIQHEINHLDGKLIIDFLSKLKKDLSIKKLSKTKQNTDRILV